MTGFMCQDIGIIDPYQFRTVHFQFNAAVAVGTYGTVTVGNLNG